MIEAVDHSRENQTPVPQPIRRHFSPVIRDIESSQGDQTLLRGYSTHGESLPHLKLQLTENLSGCNSC
jgi:hypothetical protein